MWRSQVSAESDVDTVFVSVRNAFDKLALKDANVVFVLGALSYTHCSHAYPFRFRYLFSTILGTDNY